MSSVVGIAVAGIGGGGWRRMMPHRTQTKLAVRPHLVLVVHIADLTASPESERCRNAAQNRHRKRSAQCAKKASLADANVDRQFRHEIGDGCDPGSDSLHAAAQPADRPRQCHLRPANEIGGGFRALGRLHRTYASLDRIKQARQPGRKKIWQKAERLTRLGAVPPSYA